MVSSADGGGDGGVGVGGSNPKAGHNDVDHLESGGYHRNSTSHQNFSSVAVRITLVFVVVAVTCLILNQSAYPTKLFERSYSFSGLQENISSNVSSPGSCDNHASSQVNEETIKLENILKKAAMKDTKTVIITTLNAAWTEPNSIFDLFLESFRVGNETQRLLKHVVVAALDQKAYARCTEEQLHCYALATTGVDFSGEAVFMTKNYLKMMWRRIHFLLTVLQIGYDFVFTDADVMWFRDPFPRFYPDGDFQIACDHYWYNYTDLNNSPNGGFNYVKSNNRTIRFYEFWYNRKDYFPGKHDQDVLNEIKFDPCVSDIGVQFRFLDTAYFGGFCEPSKDMDLVITMHANCCIGLENKIHDIKMAMDDWKRYMSLPGGVERNPSSRSWTVPRICG